MSRNSMSPSPWRATAARLTVVIAALSSTLIPLALVHIVASAAPAADPASLAQYQYPLERLATNIHRIEETRPSSGFAGTEFVLSQRQLILYWKGLVPTAISDALHTITPGYTYDVKDAAYSLNELKAEMKSLLAWSAANPNARVVRIGPRPDYSGLIVGVNSPPDVQYPVVPSSIPITLIRESAGVFLGRQDDTPAFWGGGRLNLGGSPQCTTGFGMKTWATGTLAISTAYHCGSGQTFTNGNNTYTVGRGGTCCYTIDAMLITGSSYGNRIYTGAWNAGTSIQVVGSAYVSAGQIICAGGSFSGERCSGVVTYTNQYYNGFGPGYFAIRNDHADLAGHGDSGAPSYARATSTTITGYGLVDQGVPGTETSCAGVASICYWDVFFVNERDVESALNASILT